MWSYLLKRNASNQNENQNLQLFDLLQLSRKEKELKNICLSSIKYFEKWKQQFNSQDKELLDFFEGFVLKQRIKQNLLAYRIFRKNRIIAFKFYMNQLPVCGKNYYQSE